MRRLLPLLLVSLLAVAQAGIQIQETVTANPAAAVPVTLAAGTGGSTTLGSSATSATTTGAVLPLFGTVQALKVLRGAADWSVQLQASGVSGQGALDSITISLVGSTTQAQVVVSLGTLTQTSGTPVTLAAAGPDVQVTASGSCLGSCTFTLQILLTPPSSTAPALTYPYTLTVT